MPELRRTTVDVVDIVNDATLFTRYGTSIPVVATEGGAELAWPFNADDVLRLVS